ncbi:hypothetical protein BDR26DRAFT_866203 [Obelidium mucronatum]|nr:hypothetical protein BDR26DRAFT_866203 [Obelidium mucronatum]
MIHGPPLVALFMDMDTNMGNILFNLGHIEEAIDCHTKCLRLADTAFEYCPLDHEFRMSFPLSMSARFGNSMVGGIPDFSGGRFANRPQSSGSSQKVFDDPNYPTPPPDRRIQLSFLHLTIILAQARSLTHLAVCFQALGLDDVALQCNSQALEIVNFYRKYCVVGNGEAPPTTPNTNTPTSTPPINNNNNNTSDPSLDKLETDSIVSSSSVKRKISELSREQRWERQQAQLKTTKAFIKESIDPLQGVILGNLANSFYAKGRLPAALDHAGQALAVFKSLDHRLACAHALSTIHALKLEMARALKGLHWMRQMETQAVGQAEVTECTRYWGPSRMTNINKDPNNIEPDNFADASLGAVWAAPGLKGLKECFLTFKEKDDLLGMLYAMVNMATGHLLNGQPYIALFLLGSLLTEETASGLSLSTSQTAVESGQPKIPEVLRIHVHFTLCQTVFLLLRMQDPQVQQLLPQAIYVSHFDIIFCSAEPINALLPALDVVLDDFMDIDMLAMAFIGSIQELERKRRDICSSVQYAVLMLWYVGESGFFGQSYSVHRSNTVNSVGSQDSGSGNHNNSNNNNNNNSGNAPPAPQTKTTIGNNEAGFQHVFGIGVGIDFFTQQGFLIRAMTGKSDWVTASSSVTFDKGGFNSAIHFFTQGLQRLETTVKDVLQLLRAGTGDDGNENIEGLIAHLHECTMALKNMPPLCPQQVGTNLLRQPVMRFTAAIQSSPFLVPMLYAVSADLMAYGAYQMTALQNMGSVAGEAFVADLLSALKIPQTPTPAKIHKDLLEAAFDGYRGYLGMCDFCLKEALADTDRYGEFVFISKTGGVVESGGETSYVGGLTKVGRDLTLDAITEMRSTARSNLLHKHVFPCVHYYL